MTADRVPWSQQPTWFDERVYQAWLARSVAAINRERDERIRRAIAEQPRMPRGPRA
jgi:hypothetical protein